MSNSFYTGMRDTVAGPLIEKYGMALTLRRITKGTYDPNTGSMGADTTVDYPCFGLEDDRSYAYLVANSLIAREDKQLLISAKGLTVTPKIGDLIIFLDGGIWYIPEGGGLETSKFKPIQTLAPGGIAVMFTIQVRR